MRRPCLARTIPVGAHRAQDLTKGDAWNSPSSRARECPFVAHPHRHRDPLDPRLDGPSALPHSRLPGCGLFLKRNRLTAFAESLIGPASTRAKPPAIPLALAARRSRGPAALRPYLPTGLPFSGHESTQSAVYEGFPRMSNQRLFSLRIGSRQPSSQER